MSSLISILLEREFLMIVMIDIVLNKELVIVRLGSEACLLVTGVVLWLSIPLKLRQGLAFSLIRQLHADAA